MFFCVIIYELLAECLVLGTVVWKTVPYIRYRGTMVPTVPALPTLDMYLSLSKFETIHWVSNDATPQTSL